MSNVKCLPCRMDGWRWTTAGQPNTSDHADLYDTQKDQKGKTEREREKDREGEGERVGGGGGEREREREREREDKNNRNRLGRNIHKDQSTANAQTGM